jgi:hypothetical protein
LVSSYSRKCVCTSITKPSPPIASRAATSRSSPPADGERAAHLLAAVLLLRAGGQDGERRGRAAQRQQEVAAADAGATGVLVARLARSAGRLEDEVGRGSEENSPFEQDRA